MTQDVFPEIQVATEALESRIAITETEVSQMKEAIAGKRELLRSWRKALVTFNPKRAAPKKRATGPKGKSPSSGPSTAELGTTGLKHQVSGG
jgi:hypothetical protein